MAGVAGLRLQSAGYGGADLVMPAVFGLIAATMLLHGFSLGPLARRLGLHLGEGDGILIVGASRWATDFATALHKAGVQVTLADTYPGALREARRRKIPVLRRSRSASDQSGKTRTDSGRKEVRTSSEPQLQVRAMLSAI